MSRRLTLGKLRGLQQISDAHGIFAMCAMDHRESMERLISPAHPSQVTAEVLAQYKRDLTEALAPEATAVLLDPIYGAAQASTFGALAGGVGLLVSLEETGYEHNAQSRLTTLLEKWSVQKIKNMGASAVKILLYYRPDLANNAARQQSVVRRVAEDCARADIPFLLEPMAYPFTEVERDPAYFARRKFTLAADTARDLTASGVDVLIEEFPIEVRYDRPEFLGRIACEALTEASQAPWILVSTGVTFDEFAGQVRMACQAGASGFLGGRAIWEEAMHLPAARERRHWLATVGADRVRRLHDLAGEHGRPWWEKWAASAAELTQVGPNNIDRFDGTGRHRVDQRVEA